MRLRDGSIIVCDCGAELNPEIVTAADFITYADGVATCSNCSASGEVELPVSETDLSTIDTEELELFEEHNKDNGGYRELGTLPYVFTDTDLKLVKVDLVSELGDADIFIETQNKLDWQSVSTPTSYSATNVKVLAKTATGFTAKRKTTGATGYLYRVSAFIPVKPSTSYQITMNFAPDYGPAIYVFENGVNITTGAGNANGIVHSQFATAEGTSQVELRIGLGSGDTAGQYLGEWEFYNLMLLEDATGYATEYIGYGITYKVKEATTRLLSVPDGAESISSDVAAYNGVAKVYKVVTIDSGYPVYVDTEVDAVVENLLEIQNADTLSVAFMADFHYGEEYSTYPGVDNRACSDHALISVSEIAKKTAIDYLVLGGDYVLNNTINTTKTTCFQQIAAFREAVSKYAGNAPRFWLKGNHDVNPRETDGVADHPEERLTNTEFYIRTGGKADTGNVIVNPAEKEKSYGYIDFPSQKIRAIFLNTDSHLDYDAITINSHGFNAEQLVWLFSTAFDFSGKAVPTDWATVLFSHVPVQVTTNYADLLAGLLALDAGGTHTYNSVEYDYSAQGAVAVVACIAGDVHYSYSTSADGVLKISTQNISISSTTYNNPPEGAEKNTKVAGTADETSYDIFTVDRASGKLYATRYGAGVDRVWDI
ncbi:MAG: metallophosphoesterase [Proteobacteria bacterium]|jgi:hypothetical protein|nr:metallophosphoesterase [Pseudomonadota bacterium]